MDVLDELQRLVGLLFDADALAFPDVRDERRGLDAEPHPQAGRAFHVDRAVVPGGEGDLEILGAAADPPDDLHVLRDPEGPDGRPGEDQRGVGAAAGVGPVAHQVTDLAGVQTTDQEPEPEALVLELVRHQEMPVAVAHRVRGLVDPQQEYPGRAAVGVGQVEACRHRRVRAPSGKAGVALDPDPYGGGLGDVDELKLGAQLVKLAGADVRRVRVKHVFVAGAYFRHEAVQRGAPRPGSIHGHNVELRIRSRYFTY